MAILLAASSIFRLNISKCDYFYAIYFWNWVDDTLEGPGLMTSDFLNPQPWLGLQCKSLILCVIYIRVLFFSTKNGCWWFPVGIGVGRFPREQTVPELSDISFLYLEPPTTVTVRCPEIIRTKQKVLSKYAINEEEVKHFVAEQLSITWLFATVCLIYWVLKWSSFNHTALYPLWGLLSWWSHSYG